MIQKGRLDDKVFEDVDIKLIHSNDIKKHKIYYGIYFVKRENIRVALQGLIEDIDPAKDYSGKDIKDIIRKLYHKI